MGERISCSKLETHTKGLSGGRGRLLDQCKATGISLMCQGLKVRGPKVRGPLGQGLMALEPPQIVKKETQGWAMTVTMTNHKNTCEL